MNSSMFFASLTLTAPLALIAAANPVRIADNSRIFCVDDGTCIKLQWHPKAWADDQIGYTVRRRTAGSAEWQPLTPVCRPSLNPSRSGKSVGMTTEQAAAFAEWNKSSQALAAVPEEQMRTVLLQNKGVPMGNRIEMSQEGRRALALNLGWVDNTRLPDTAYEYGLFVVREGDKVDDKPVDSCLPFTVSERRDWAKVSKFKVTFISSTGGGSLAWHMPLDSVRRMAVDKFAVERKQEDGNGWITVTAGVPFSTSKKKEATWNIWDKKAPLHGSAVYRLVPTDMYGNAYAPFEYKVARVDWPPIGMKPTDLKINATPTGVDIQWVQPVQEYEQYSLIGFRLLDAIDQKNVIASTSDINANHFTISNEKLKAMTSMYFVEALFENEYGEKASQFSPSFGPTDVERVKNPRPEPSVAAPVK